MATIGNILVGLKANTATFDKKMNKSATGMQKLGGVAKGLAKSVAAIGAAFVAAGAAIAIAWTKQAMDSIDALAKTAARLQTTTEFLGKMDHAARLTGTSLDTVSSALEKMNKNLGDALMGIGTARDTIIELGLSATRLASAGTEEAFLTIADAISKLPTAAEQIQAAMNIFGRSGAGLVNLFQQGREGIEAMGMDAERLGGLVSSMDAAKIEAANDAWERVHTAINGIKYSLAIELAPILETVAGKIASLSENGESFGEKTVKAIRSVIESMVVMINVGKVIGSIFKLVGTIILGVVAVVVDMVYVIAKAIQGIVNLAKGAGRLIGIDSQNSTFADDLGHYAAALNQTTFEFAGTVIPDMVSIDDLYSGATTGAQNTAEATEAVVETQEEFSDAIETSTERVDEYAEALSHLSDTYQTLSDYMANTPLDGLDRFETMLLTADDALEQRVQALVDSQNINAGAQMFIPDEAILSGIDNTSTIGISQSVLDYLSNFDLSQFTDQLDQATISILALQRGENVFDMFIPDDDMIFMLERLRDSVLMVNELDFESKLDEFSDMEGQQLDFMIEQLNAYKEARDALAEGFTSGEILSMEEFIRQARELEEGFAQSLSLAQLGEQLSREAMTPLDEFEERIEELSTAFNAGVISEDVFNTLAEKAREAYENTIDIDDTPDMTPLDPGQFTQLSSHIELQGVNLLEQQQQDPQLEVQRQQLAVNQRSQQLLQQLVDQSGVVFGNS